MVLSHIWLGNSTQDVSVHMICVSDTARCHLRSFTCFPGTPVSFFQSSCWMETDVVWPQGVTDGRKLADNFSLPAPDELFQEKAFCITYPRSLGLTALGLHLPIEFRVQALPQPQFSRELISGQSTFHKCLVNWNEYGLNEGFCLIILIFLGSVRSWSAPPDPLVGASGW